LVGFSFSKIIAELKDSPTSERPPQPFHEAVLLEKEISNSNLTILKLVKAPTTFP